MSAASSTRTGLLQGIGAYTLWGALPLYLHLLSGCPAAAGDRTPRALVAGPARGDRRRHPAIAPAARRRARPHLLMLAGSATLIAINWFVYIWAVDNAHLVEASLGYFINPLVNVALGTLLLHERLGRVQAIAIGLAACGVLIFALNGGGAIWISLPGAQLRLLRLPAEDLRDRFARRADRRNRADRTRRARHPDRRRAQRHVSLRQRDGDGPAADPRRPRHRRAAAAVRRRRAHAALHDDRAAPVHRADAPVPRSGAALSRARTPGAARHLRADLGRVRPVCVEQRRRRRGSAAHVEPAAR